MSRAPVVVVSWQLDAVKVVLMVVVTCQHVEMVLVLVGDDVSRWCW
jgi:hypothetical protein